MFPGAAVGVAGLVPLLARRLPARVVVGIVTAGALAATALAADYSVSSRDDTLLEQRRDVDAVTAILPPHARILSVVAPEAMVLAHQRNPSRFQILSNGLRAYLDDTWPGGTAGYARWIGDRSPEVIAVGRTLDRSWLQPTLDAGYDQVGRTSPWLWYVRRDVGKDTLQRLREALSTHSDWHADPHHDATTARGRPERGGRLMATTQGAREPATAPRDPSYSRGPRRGRLRGFDPLIPLTGSCAALVYVGHGFDGYLTRDLGVYATAASRSPRACRRTSRSSTAPARWPTCSRASARGSPGWSASTTSVGMRVLFMLFAAASVAAAYLLGRDLFRSRLAGLAAAAALLCLKGFVIYATGGPREKTPLVLFCLLAALLAVVHRRWAPAGCSSRWPR